MNGIFQIYKISEIFSFSKKKPNIPNLAKKYFQISVKDSQISPSSRINKNLRLFLFISQIQQIWLSQLKYLHGYTGTPLRGHDNNI